MGRFITQQPKLHLACHDCTQVLICLWADDKLMNELYSRMQESNHAALNFFIQKSFLLLFPYQNVLLSVNL
jgi:hypothetical protein